MSRSQSPKGSANTYLAVSTKAGGQLPPKIAPILGNYTPTQGSETVFKTPAGMKLYYSSGYWYFDTLSEKQVAWAEGVATKVPVSSWKAPAESLFMAYNELPLVVSLEKAELMGSIMPASPTKAAAATAASLRAKASEHLDYATNKAKELHEKHCGDGCRAKMENCSQGLKKKMANDQIGSCCEGVGKHIETVKKQYSNSSMAKTLSNTGQALKDGHAKMKEKAGKHYETFTETHAPYIKQKTGEHMTYVKQKTGEHYERVRDVHLPYVKQKTGEYYNHVKEVHLPYVTQKSGEAYEKFRDVHAPYIKQKTGEHAAYIRQKTGEHAYYAKDLAVKGAGNCHEFVTHPETHASIKTTCLSFRRMTCNVVKFCLRGCVMGIVKCLDKSLAICGHDDTPQSTVSVPQAAALETPAEASLSEAASSAETRSAMEKIYQEAQVLTG
mmetsp:Transcript_4022/g.6669  ORF Transcript_4022/g.6669 Transcript_4022/m.6669 type:complete len:441 (-) Transcript_4022:73-1395(-)